MSASATSATSTPSASPQSSPRPDRKLVPTASAVNGLAINNISRPASTTSASLTSAETKVDPWIEKYHQACQLLSEGKYLEANDLFSTLIATYKGDESNSLNFANCYIGVVHSSSETYPDRKLHLIEAKRLLDLVYEKTREHAQRKPNDEAVIDTFAQLGASYQKLHLDYADVNEIKDKIAYCSSHIPLSSFYAQLDKVEAPEKQDKPEQALAIIHAYMPVVNSDEKDPELLVAGAMGNLKLALLSSSGLNRNHHATLADQQTLKAYDRKEELYTNDEMKTKFLNYFITLFEGLSRLVTWVDYSEKLEQCRSELANLQLKEGPKPSQGSKAASEPAGNHWKAAKLFIAFSIAAAVIVGAVVLGRRLITRLN